jgi:hypothetical protein
MDPLRTYYENANEINAITARRPYTFEEKVAFAKRIGNYFRQNLMGADDPTPERPWKETLLEALGERKFFDKSVIEQPKDIEAQMSYGEVDAWHGGGKFSKFAPIPYRGPQHGAGSHLSFFATWLGWGKPLSASFSGSHNIQ